MFRIAGLGVLCCVKIDGAIALISFLESCRRGAQRTVPSGWPSCVLASPLAPPSAPRRTRPCPRASTSSWWWTASTRAQTTRCSPTGWAPRRSEAAAAAAGAKAAAVWDAPHSKAAAAVAGGTGSSSSWSPGHAWQLLVGGG